MSEFGRRYVGFLVWCVAAGLFLAACVDSCASVRSGGWGQTITTEGLGGAIQAPPNQQYAPAAAPGRFDSLVVVPESDLYFNLNSNSGGTEERNSASPASTTCSDSHAHHGVFRGGISCDASTAELVQFTTAAIVDTPENDTSFTASIWFRLNNGTNPTTGFAHMWRFEAGSSDLILFSHLQTSNKIQTLIQSTGGTCVITSSAAYTYSANTLHHFAVVADVANDALTLYVDGVEDSSAAVITGCSGALPASFTDTRFGGRTATAGQGVDGVLDEANYWSNTMLSSAQVAQVYAQHEPLTVSTSEDVYWLADFESYATTTSIDTTNIMHSNIDGSDNWKFEGSGAASTNPTFTLPCDSGKLVRRKYSSAEADSYAGCVSFDGGDYADSPHNAFSLSQPWSGCLVFRDDSVDGTIDRYVDYSTNGGTPASRTIVSRDAAAAMNVNNATDAKLFTSTQAVTQGQWNLLCWTANGTSSKIKLNTNTEETGDLGTTGAAAFTLMAQASGAGTKFVTGSLAAFVTDDGASDYATIRAHLVDVFGEFPQ